MAESPQPTTSTAELQLLATLWSWQQHNPVNLFVYRPGTASGELVHPASGASLPATRQEVAALIQRGWLRGGSDLMLAYAGLRRCRELTDAVPALPAPWWHALSTPLTKALRVLPWARWLRLRQPSASSVSPAAAIVLAPRTADQR